MPISGISGTLSSSVSIRASHRHSEVSCQCLKCPAQDLIGRSHTHSNRQVLLVILALVEDLLGLGHRGEDKGLAVAVALVSAVYIQYTHVGSDTEVDLLGGLVGLEVLGDAEDGVGGAGVSAGSVWALRATPAVI